MAARREWDLKPVTDRAQIFLKAADMLSGPHRAEVLAKTMVGQVRCLGHSWVGWVAVEPHPIQQTSAEQLLGAETCSAGRRPGEVFEGLGGGPDKQKLLNELVCAKPACPTVEMSLLCLLCPHPWPGLCHALPGLSVALCRSLGSVRPLQPGVVFLTPPSGHSWLTNRDLCH